MGSGPAIPPADSPRAACTQLSLLPAHCCTKRSSRTWGRAVTTPKASVCGAGMCSAGPVQAQRRPLAICPPTRLLCIPLGVRERSSPRDLEKTGVGGPSGAAAGSQETLEDTLLPRRFPESKSHFPGRRATENAPASPSREPVTLSLAEPDTPFSCPVFALCRLTRAANPNRPGILECSLLLKS